MTLPEPGGQRSGARRAGEWVALALHVAVGFFPYSATGLLMPLPGVAVMYVLWFALFAVAWRWRPRNSWVLLAIPLAAIVVWVAGVSLGEAVFGFTA